MSLHHHGEAWYAVYCRPFKERAAGTALARQLGLTVYLPEIKQRRRGVAAYRPFFPRYLFVRADLVTVAIHRINTIPSVVRLVGCGEAPQPLAAATIDALRERVDALNRQGGLPRHDFRPGNPVRLKEGPLQGLEAVFIGPLKPSERVRILVEFLGRPQVAEVPVDALEPAEAAPAEAAPARPARRTRGGGRVIKAAASLTRTKEAANA